MNRDIVLFAQRRNALSSILLSLAVLVIGGCRQAQPDSYELRVPSMAVTFDQTGAVQQVVIPGPDGVRRVRAFTVLRDCEPEGSVTFTRNDSLLSFRRKWTSRAGGHSALVTDVFRRGNGSVRWEVEVAGLDGSWSTPIETHLI
jgi:hypothetical protein